MRTFLTATVAAAALFGAAAAQAQVVGHVGANYAHSDTDVAGFDFDGDAFQLEGAAAFKVGGLGAQVDGSYTDGEDMDGVWSATGHLNGDLGGALVGGFAGFTSSDGDTLWGLGAEAQGNLAASTVLYGQVGYGQTDEDLGDLDLWAVRGELRHYFADNIRLSGSVGYTNIDADGFSGSADLWNFGVEGEYQFAGTPFSVFGGYVHSDADDLDLNADTFQVGVRYTIGGATLRGRDEAGAMLAGVGKLFGGLN